jgi:hypothetical protein
MAASAASSALLSGGLALRNTTVPLTMLDPTMLDDTVV